MIMAGRFTRADRLLRREDFRYVARHGRRLDLGLFVVLVATRKAQGRGKQPRLGITASQRVGKAVVRNALKRSIREWFRQERSSMAEDLDIVVIAQQGAAHGRRSDVIEALRAGVRAAGVGV